MSELEAKFRVSLQGKNELEDFFSRSERGARSFSSNLSNALKGAGKDIASFTYNAGKGLAQLATGNLGIASQAKSVLELRNNIAALSLAAGKGAAGIEPLRQEIHRISQATNQMQDNVTDAMSAFVAKTGDIKTATANMTLYGRVATATGASLREVAEVGVELSDKLGIKDQADAMAVLVAQAKAGRIEFKDMAAYAPKILAAASSSGAKNLEGIAGAGAAIQVIAKAAGGSQAGARAATMYERMVATVQTNKSRERIAALGIDVSHGRDVNEIFMDIARKTGGDPTKMRDIFRQAEAARGAEMFAKQYRETKGFGDFEKYRSEGSSAALPGNRRAVDADFEVMRHTGMASLNASQIKIAEVMDNKVGPAFELAATHAEKLGHAFEWAGNHMKTTAALLVGAVVGKNALSAGLGGGGGGVVGKMLGGGVQHVWVDNMPAGGMGGGGGPGPAPKGSRAVELAKKAAAIVATGYAAYEFGRELDEATGFTDALVDATQGRSQLVDEVKRQPGTLAYYEAQQRRRATIKRRSGEMAIASPRHGEAGFGNLDQAMKVDLGGVVVNIQEDKATVAVGGTRTEKALLRRGR